MKKLMCLVCMCACLMIAKHTKTLQRYVFKKKNIFVRLNGTATLGMSAHRICCVVREHTSEINRPKSHTSNDFSWLTMKKENKEEKACIIWRATESETRQRKKKHYFMPTQIVHPYLFTLPQCQLWLKISSFYWTNEGKNNKHTQT